MYAWTRRSPPKKRSSIGNGRPAASGVRARACTFCYSQTRTQAPTGATNPAEQPHNPVETAEAPADMFRATEGRWGTRELEITGVTIAQADGTPSHVFHTGDPLTLKVGFRAHQPTRDFVFGVGIFNADGLCCYGTNTNIDELEPDRLSGEGEVRFVIDRLDLVEGTYKFDVAAHKLDGFPYDYHRQLYTIRVKSRLKDVGISRPPHRWEVTGDVKFRPPGSGFRRGDDTPAD